MTKQSILLGLGLILVPTLASAQPMPERRQDRRELRQDQREVRQDQRQMQDDIRDARRYAMLLTAFDQARASGQPGQLVAIDQRVQAALNAEINESNREAAQKQAEAARSQGEVRRDRREVGRDVRQGRPVQGADDRRDLRDDRRDVRDDRRDAQQEIRENNRLRALAQSWAGLMGRMDPASLNQKRAILADLNALAAHEIREGREEIREDRREKREDRRELREDRRQGR